MDGLGVGPGRVEDAVRASASAEVRVTELEERPVPDALFDPEDGSERRRLEGGSGSRLRPFRP